MTRYPRAALATLLLLAAGSCLARPQPQQQSHPGPVQTLAGFYHHLNQQDLNSAYSLLDESWRQELSFNEFTHGYAQTTQWSVTVTSSKWRTGLCLIRCDLMCRDSRGKATPFRGMFCLTSDPSCHYRISGSKLTPL